MPRQSRIERVEFSLAQFLANDWEHQVRRLDALDTKVNLILAAISLVVLGVFAPLAVHLWSTWLWQ